MYEQTIKLYCIPWWICSVIRFLFTRMKNQTSFFYMRKWRSKHQVTPIQSQASNGCQTTDSNWDESSVHIHSLNGFSFARHYTVRWNNHATLLRIILVNESLRSLSHCDGKFLWYNFSYWQWQFYTIRRFSHFPLFSSMEILSLTHISVWKPDSGYIWSPHGKALRS